MEGWLASPEGTSQKMLVSSWLVELVAEQPRHLVEGIGDLIQTWPHFVSSLLVCWKFHTTGFSSN